MSSSESLGTVSNALREREGVLSHRVLSPFQNGETRIHVLLPDELQAGVQYKSLYVLPVERLDGQGWGDALGEIRRHDLHNHHRLICIMPTFTHAPWYADHPTDPHICQETHFLQVVIPFVESRYSVITEYKARLLLGFSKSGWGAYSLLLRHPDKFGNAAAWDAPLGQDSPNKYGMSEVFADQTAFEPYCVWGLLKERAELLRAQPRLALLGYGDFRGHHQATHHYMLKHGILHHYQDGPRRQHHWESGWVSEAVEVLLHDSHGKLPVATNT